jgi:dihydrofolate reductase
MSVSVDGFISGPGHLDAGFYRVQDWVDLVFDRRERGGIPGSEPDDVDDRVVDAMFADVGAYVMGRGMFDVGEKPWGETPPFEAPVFVATHRARPLLECEGGTTFTFVTDGLRTAVNLAREAAGGKDVAIAGGAQVVRAAIDDDLVDELHLHVSPVLLGTGMPLFADLAPRIVELERVEVIASPHVTHIRYRLGDSLG